MTKTPKRTEPFFTRDTAAELQYDERDLGDWIVSTRWTTQAEDRLPVGPSEVVISIAPNASPLVRQRGVNSGVLRRVEGVVLEMAEENASVIRRALEGRALETEGDVDFTAFLRDQVAALPEAGPRSRTGDYYGELLHLYEMLEVVEQRPIELLARLMQVPVNTLKSRLRRARILRKEEMN